MEVALFERHGSLAQAGLQPLAGLHRALALREAEPASIPFDLSAGYDDVGPSVRDTAAAERGTQRGWAVDADDPGSPPVGQSSLIAGRGWPVDYEVIESMLDVESASGTALLA